MPEQPENGEEPQAGGLRARRERFRQQRQPRTPPPPQHPRPTGVPAPLRPRTSVDGELAAPADLTRPVDTIAANPLNTRDLTRKKRKIERIATSIKEIGQLDACPAVTRGAFLAIFPGHVEAIGGADVVLAGGDCRRAAVLHAELTTLKVVVDDSWAISRLRFLEVTAAENLDRDDLDPIEEAEALELMVQEAGSAAAVADRLGKSEGWVSQKRALLKLIPEVREAMRAEEEDQRLSFSIVRKWPAKATESQQLQLLEQWRAGTPAFTAVKAKTGGAPAAQPGRRHPLSAAASAMRRFDGDLAAAAQKLRRDLPDDERRQLAEDCRQLAQELLRPDQM